MTISLSDTLIALVAYLLTYLLTYLLIYLLIVFVILLFCFSHEEGHCDYNDYCVKAHSTEELGEWHQRMRYRQAKWKISQRYEAIDLTYQNVTEFRWEVAGADVACDRPLEVHLTDKTATYSWIFHIQVGDVIVIMLWYWLFPTCPWVYSDRSSPPQPTK